MPHPPIVVSDLRDENPRKGDITKAHEEGQPHRVAHMEIMDSQGRFFVCKRDDDRLEIPGGHVDWLSRPAVPRPRPETYEEAALRETAEELFGFEPGHYSRNALEKFVERLRREANPRPVARTFNQVPSSHGNNTEHIVVYRITLPDELKRKVKLTEGKDPEWWTAKKLEAWAMRPKNWLKINAALRLLLQRRGVLVPLRLEFFDNKPSSVAGFGKYEWGIRKKPKKTG